MRLMFSLILLAVPGVVPAATPWLDGKPRTVVAELFGWNWKSVARECTAVLGPKGYRAVKVMPANEHVADGHWWARYQPVSYQLQSWGGTRAEFAAMVETCRAAGVEVEADVIINHMANGVGTGSAGSWYDVNSLSYPGVPFGSSDFHPPCTMQTADVSSYTRCWLGRKPGDNGLPDLDTARPWVQERIRDHLRDLRQIGVQRLYVDAAKHIEVNELKSMLAAVPELGVAQEVWTDAVSAMPLYQKNYLPLGLVTEFNYARVIRTTFKGWSGRSLAAFNTFLQSPDRVPTTSALVFVTNHDLERSACTSTSLGGDCATLTVLQPELYFPANVFMLAHPYGTPYVYSSYYFAGPGDGPPAPPWQDHEPQASGCSATVEHGRWNCSHRDWRIANMVGFRNYTDGQPLLDWLAEGAARVAFRRGNAGFVALNNTASWWQRSFATGLPDGRYCNVLLSASPETGNCPPDTQVMVSGGQASLSVPPYSAAALHIGARPACDNADDFSFVPVHNAQPGSWQTSNSVTISGLGCPAAVQIDQGEYRINGGAWTSVAGSINNGQSLQLRLLAPAAGTTRMARLQVGRDVAGFSVSSRSDSCSQSPLCTVPSPLRAGQKALVVYRGFLSSSGQLTLHWGINGWQSIRNTPMQRASDGSWQVQLDLASSIWELDFVVTDGWQWDNNGWQDWRLPVTAAGPSGASIGQP